MTSTKLQISFCYC